MAAKKKTPNASAKATHEAPRAEPARVQRPTLPRTEPIRSWSTLFGDDSAVARAQAAYSSGARTASESVQRGVELGYRVMDEYLRQGAAAADSFTGRGRQQSQAPNDFSFMAERMMRSAQDFSSLWFDMMGTLMSNMPSQGVENGRSAPPPRSAPQGNGQRPSPQQNPGRFRILVRVDSARPTEVTLAMDAEPGAILLEPLRAAAGELELEARLSLPAGDGLVAQLAVQVPADFPADRYTGAVLDEQTGRPVGRITVAVFE